MRSIRSSIPTAPALTDQIDQYYERLQQARNIGELRFIESQLKNFLTINHEAGHLNNCHHRTVAHSPAPLPAGRDSRRLP